MNISPQVLTDDVVIYIANRHHCSVKKIMDCYQQQLNGSKVPETGLEPNEMQIISDLIKMCER